MEEITGYKETIKSNSEKILKRSRVVRESLARQVDTLDSHLAELKEILESPQS